MPPTGPRTTSYRRDLLWVAALVHRLSGLALALFLPLHFLVLGLAIEADGRLDAVIGWTRHPVVKLAEVALVVLLALHLLGGLRVLAIEATTYLDRQKQIAAAVLIAAGLVGLAFALAAF